MKNQPYTKYLNIHTECGAAFQFLTDAVVIFPRDGDVRKKIQSVDKQTGQCRENFQAEEKRGRSKQRQMLQLSFTENVGQHDDRRLLYMREGTTVIWIG